MKDHDDEVREAIALFRYGVIADLVHRPRGAPGTGERLKEIAGRTYVIPGSDRTRVAVNTLRGWVKLYRDGGFEALYPKPRTDRGLPRRLPAEVAERLVALKTDNPDWSVRSVIRAAGEEGIDHPLAPSTVHRLFSREGLFDKKPGDGTDRRRFAFKEAGELWMGDVMHGPKIKIGRTRRKTYLIAFIDDATRVVPFAAFAAAENVQAFLPVFKNAIIRRGICQRLYVEYVPCHIFHIQVEQATHYQEFTVELGIVAFRGRLCRQQPFQHGFCLFDLPASHRQENLAEPKPGMRRQKFVVDDRQRALKRADMTFECEMPAAKRLEKTSHCRRLCTEEGMVDGFRDKFPLLEPATSNAVQAWQVGTESSPHPLLEKLRE